MVIGLLWEEAGVGEGQHGCSMIMLNSHHPVLPSSTQLSSPPPQHCAPPPTPPPSSQLHPDMLTLHQHRQTRMRTCTGCWSVLLIPVSASKRAQEVRRKEEERTRSWRSPANTSSHMLYDFIFCAIQLATLHVSRISASSLNASTETLRRAAVGNNWFQATGPKMPLQTSQQVNEGKTSPGEGSVIRA